MASRSIEKGNAASGAVQAAGIKGQISSIQLDVTDQSSIAAAVKRVEGDHGRLDVLVNNAGSYVLGSIFLFNILIWVVRHVASEPSILTP